MKFHTKEEQDFWKQIVVASLTRPGETEDVALACADRVLAEYRERSSEIYLRFNVYPENPEALQKRKIPAIKALRSVSNVTLRIAKEVIEATANGLPIATNVSKESAMKLKRAFELEGYAVEIRGSQEP